MRKNVKFCVDDFKIILQIYSKKNEKYVDQKRDLSHWFFLPSDVDHHRDRAMIAPRDARKDFALADALVDPFADNLEIAKIIFYPNRLPYEVVETPADVVCLAVANVGPDDEFGFKFI